MTSPHPTDEPMRIRFDQLPHGFHAPSISDMEWMQSSLNSDIRLYYKLLRTGVDPPLENPIGMSGITVGELALFALRESHRKRKRRYPPTSPYSTPQDSM